MPRGDFLFLAFSVRILTFYFDQFKNSVNAPVQFEHTEILGR